MEKEGRKMRRYLAIYKCRLCGETFCAKEAGGRRAALNAAICASMGKLPEPNAPTLNDIHSCEDGSIGIADFIGFKEESESDNA